VAAAEVSRIEASPDVEENGDSRALNEVSAEATGTATAIATTIASVADFTAAITIAPPTTDTATAILHIPTMGTTAIRTATTIDGETGIRTRIARIIRTATTDTERSGCVRDNRCECVGVRHLAWEVGLLERMRFSHAISL